MLVRVYVGALFPVRFTSGGFMLKLAAGRKLNAVEGGQAARELEKTISL